MRIAASDLMLVSRHEQSRTVKVHERLETWVGTRQEARVEEGVTVDPRRDGPMASEPELSRLLTSLRQAANKLRARVHARAVKSVSHVATQANEAAKRRASEMAESGDPKELMLRELVRVLSGKEVETIDKDAIQKEPADGVQATAPSASGDAPQPAASPATSQEGPEGWGMVYERTEEHVEREVMEFAAAGSVTTADGRTINFVEELAMLRERAEVESQSIRAGDAKQIDPLVLNLSDAPVSFDPTRMQFDLDADGAAEDIATLSQGSAYLALDKNQDGVVNDGRELFGPMSGDGFLELARLDDDKNQWIDEADSAYETLRLWNPVQATLASLKEAGVGAISLQNIQTPFSVMSGEQVLAQVAATGVFLHENGEVGTIQHVDLVA